MYTGYTDNLKKRVEMHNKGFVPSIKLRAPLKLIYYESCINRKDAFTPLDEYPTGLRREKYLKSGNGKKYLKSRLNNFWVDIKRESRGITTG